jgi:hypothetical protein
MLLISSALVETGAGTGWTIDRGFGGPDVNSVDLGEFKNESIYVFKKLHSMREQ